jgi:hypothetical protein
VLQWRKKAFHLRRSNYCLKEYLEGDIQMTFRTPIVFILIMFIGPILKLLTPDHWEVWQRALLGGVSIGLLVYIIEKVRISEKKMPLWLGISFMIAGFILSVYFSEFIEQQASY